MPLSNAELEIVTRDYLLADGKQATDIYFETSWLMQYLMKQQKGLWKLFGGGRKVKVPLKYDGAEAGFYQRNDTLSEDERQNITAAYFELRHAFGNATIYRADELQNAGEEAEVELVQSKIEDAMESCRDTVAKQLYAAGGDNSPYLTGLLSLCNENADLAYGELTENGVVAKDGSKPWEGKLLTTPAVISLDTIREMRRTAKVKGKKPDIGVTTDLLWDKIAGILQVQQRFTSDKPTAEAGFQNLVIEGMTLTVDDYMPSGHLFCLNSKHVGFAVHRKGYFARTPWKDLTSGAQGRSMKILWDGNLISNNRKAHIGRSNLSAA
ncbi:phage major capsid protein [Desulfocurvibacter africanus]|uniref:phage major capsid protein n=1 Tax=Desulfocurvibacter africanus TaxID=873 RepID=UPI0004022F64|nr:phage major capsid protein [Desulfocurvibacter africanus]